MAPGKYVMLYVLVMASSGVQGGSGPDQLTREGGDLNTEWTLITEYLNSGIEESSEKCYILQDLNARYMNLSEQFNDTYDYDTGIQSIQVTENYLEMLEEIYESFEHLNRSLNVHKPSASLIPTLTNKFPCKNHSQNLLMKARESLFYQKIILAKLEITVYFRDYIDPPVYIVILVTGLTCNIILLLMFAQKKEIRTAPNIMIFNIVIADVLNLTFNLPLQYFGFYYPSYVRLSEPVCVLFVTLRCMFTSASALSVVALSAQRFCATLPAFHNLKARSRSSSLIITIVYILLVWAAASSIVLPDTLREKVCDDNPAEKSGRKSAKVVSLHEFVVYCFALPGIMFIFTFLTARRLKQSAKEIPGDVRHKTHEKARNRGAKVVTALCVVFTISYVPFFMWGRIATTLGLDRLELSYRVLDNLTYYLLFSNPCFNPLALYVTSHTFRRLFNGYLFGWCLKRGKQQRTDSQISLDNTTTQSSRQQESDV
ncbi:neuromedin-B receptor-like [Zootermopsis nevadensis]|uniref:Neuromedin-B receptor n=1 Tax=Zootermopsis nevadensis TaxID=136037 RepID=A0A067RKM4_ZOONE|nr:neuromedin-B receptor-like [Zootermopsis nevadensis]KDR24382.1 Neuromedin-B receptor [Zootermopsis nevadensis]